MELRLQVFAITHSGGSKNFEPLVESLKSVIAEVNLRVVEEQPAEPSFDMNLFKAALRSIVSDLKVFWRISGHRGLTLRCAGFFLQAAKSLLVFASHPRRNSTTKWRERILFEKHKAVITYAANAREELSLVVESDAYELPITKIAVDLMLQKLAARSSEPIIIFVAEGFTFEQLGLQAVGESIPLDEQVRLSATKPSSSNTSCGYVISKAAAKVLVDYFLKSKAIGCADWNLSDALRSTNLICYHAVPSIIGHGSRAEGTSSIR